ncbi:translation initiation factor IF-3 [Candidatus Bipolaricaulota bacterium]|nr:translation initiation factor IF-3 [Candidatus Bipolaricaulota bacterium]
MRANRVLVIDDNGVKLGEMTSEQALVIAKEKGLDLVEVTTTANPVVCKIIDYGKYRYQQDKRKRKLQHKRSLKELQFSIRIGEHDFKTKLNRMRKFLLKGDKVRVTIFFRGREIVHLSRGQQLMERIVEQTKDIAQTGTSPKIKGKILQMILVPLEGQEKSRRSKGEKDGKEKDT